MNTDKTKTRLFVLIWGLSRLLQNGQLQIAAGLKHGAALVKEMGEMQVKISVDGNEQYGAWREGEHDDWYLRWRWLVGR